MKTSRKVISLVLSVIMIMTTFVVAAPFLMVSAADSITITSDDGQRSVTQQRVVGTDGSYKETYEKYAADFLNGHTEPTDIVIPGLASTDDYTVQGMAYYEAKDWIMISAYYGDSNETGTKKPSVLYALDATTGDFVAWFEIYNSDGSMNTDHGGGLAFSKNNFYYSGDDTDLEDGDTVTDGRAVSYAPLSQFDKVNEDGYGKITLVDSIDFYELGTAATAYVCYDNGILWLGNFYAEDVKVLITVSDSKYDGKANSSYNSMVYGYNLSGNDSATEWANLKGATSTTDCQGNPSYCLCLDNSIYNVQYAIVDNGKLYLSRSWGVGETSGIWGSISKGVAGLSNYSTLSIFDIDLSTHGDKTITINTNASGGTRTVTDAYYMSGGTHHDLMPMSEGICVIDDYFYINFESATYKYREKGDGNLGTCKSPIDVVWKIDQYALFDEERPQQDKSMYYEKVTSLSQIESDEEYMILYESPKKDLVTQMPILYAISCDNGFKGYKLSKHGSADSNGYVGTIGHPITEYSIENGKLYLNNPEEDDVVENRWTISGTLSENGNNLTNLRIKSASTYFSKHRNFYFNKDTISMAADYVSDLNNMQFDAIGNGNYYFQNAGSYLWCNDFSDASYEAKVNQWYETAADASSSTANMKFMYKGLTETVGTFHPNGLGDTNVIGKSVDPNFYLGEMQIYKRVRDVYSETSKSRVYADMNAELQEDGTYTITMETYARNPIQYQVTEDRPTDFIFVLDASASMIKNSDCYTYTNAGTQDITYNNVGDNDWYILFEGEYCKLTRHSYSYNWGFNKYYCVDFTTSDGRKFHFTKNGIIETGSVTNGGEETCKTNEYGVDKGSGKTSHGSCEVYTRTGITRLEQLKKSMTNVVNSIAASSIDHRIAVVQFGSEAGENWLATGMYNTDGTSLIQYSGDGSITAAEYQKAFYSKSAAETVKSIINNITPINESSGDSDTYVNYGFEMANNIIENSDAKYLAENDGTRNVCVIMVTDGIPGNSKDNATEATRVANLAITQAYNVKQQGASVFACQMGSNTVDGFSMHNYLEYVSSNYPVAESLTVSGAKNSDNIDYHIDVDYSMGSTEDVLSKKLISAIDANEDYSAGILRDSTVVYQQLTDAFLLPVSETGTKEYNVTYSLVPGFIDCVGRVKFKESEATSSENAETIGLNSTFDETNKAIKISKYNYADQYIAKGKDGNMLRVTISGVLANEAADIINTSINNTTTTAIYQNSTRFGDGKAFKYFPKSAFSIPEYTYVLDYGIPMLDVDVNGTLCAVSDGLTKQDVDAYKAKDPSTQQSANGLVAITDKNQNLLYTTTPTNFTDSGYCLIQRDDGSYDWFEIKVVPASNVLFEESSMVDGASKANSAAWSAVTDGSPVKPYQSLTNDKTDVYGYDEAYAQTEHCYSNGGAYKAVVNSSQKRSATKTFDFVGDRFDLISACGPNTGIMVVKVSGGSLERPKTFIVDTYYRPEGENANLANTNGLICQTPIVSFSGERGTYTVEATAAYLSTAKALKSSVTGTTSKGKLEATSGVPVTQADAKALLAELGMSDLANSDIELVWFDDNSILNGGSGAAGNINTRGTRTDGSATKSLDCYIDGFRIYHPVSSEDIEYIESEQNAQYINVIDCIKKGQIGTDGSASFDGIAYVEKALEGLAFANYNQVGPQNELYLKGGSTNDALVLKVGVAPNGKVHLGLRAVTGTAQVKIGVGTEEAGTAKTFTINGATEMYYDVTSYAQIDGQTATITIQNTGSGVLAVNNIKLTGDATMSMVTAEDMDSAYALMNAPAEKAEVVNGVVTPIVEDTDNDTDIDNGTDTDTDNDNTGDAGSGTGSGTGSSNLSFIEQLIAKIMEILSSIFKFLPVGGVA